MAAAEVGAALVEAHAGDVTADVGGELHSQFNGAVAGVVGHRGVADGPQMVALRIGAVVVKDQETGAAMVVPPASVRR